MPEIGTPSSVYIDAWASSDPAWFVAVWQTHAEIAQALGMDRHAARAHATERMTGAGEKIARSKEQVR